MSLVARMFLQKSTEHAGTSDGREVLFTVITRGDEAKEWAKYTPSGQLTMYVTNPDALPQFEVGSEYLVTLRLVRRRGDKEDLPE